MDTIKKSTRAFEISKGFNYGGLVYQIDNLSRNNIAGKVISLLINPDVTEVTWISDTKDANGKDVVNTFTKEEFFIFAKAVEEHYENIIFSTK